MRFTYLAPMVGVLVVGCSEPTPATPAAVAEQARAQVEYDPAGAADLILKAPANVQADPEVQAILQLAQRQTSMTADERRADNLKLAVNRSLASLSNLNVNEVQTIEGVAEAHRVFRNATAAVRLSENGAVPAEGAAEAAKLKTLLIRRQGAMFPAMRRTHAAYLGAEVEGAGVAVRTGGKAAKTLRVASSAFYSADTIQRAHEKLVGGAIRMRFTRADYSPYFGGPVTSYKVNGRADDEVSY